MKAALYIRVSTDEQADEGYSVSAQINQLTEYCDKNNVEIFKIYSDEGMSGQKENRPEFQKMIKDAEKKLFNIILVHKFDRFARRVELSQRIKRQLKSAGVNVVSITEPIEESPIGFFQEGILELLAEYYVKNLSQEIKKGQAERASQGLHNGSVPYGYRIDHSSPAKMSVNKEQAKVVKYIFDMYVNDGYGSTKIARILNEQGIPSALNKEWAYFTVSRILNNPKYAGYIKHNDELYEGKHEPMITKEVFELVQQYRKDRTWKRAYRGANYERYALLGILRCGYCGKVMRLQKYTRNHDGYVCNEATHRDKLDRCQHTKVYRTTYIEEIVENEIKQAIEQVTAIDVNIPGTNEFITNRKSKLESRLKRLKEAYLNGAFELDEFLDTKKSIEKELSEAVAAPSKKVDTKSAWEKYNLSNSPVEKRNILKEFISSIEVTRESVYINWQ